MTVLIIETIILLTFIAFLLRLVTTGWKNPVAYFITWFLAFLAIFAMIKWLWHMP
jgi:hypothetical protein